MRVSRLVDDGGEAGRVAQEVLVQALLLLHCNCRKCKFLFTSIILFLREYIHSKFILKKKSFDNCLSRLGAERVASVI